MAEPLERLTAALNDSHRSKVRVTASSVISRLARMDSPLFGGGAVIISDAAGWMLIWGIARLISAKPDTFLVLTIFWFGQFCWGAALAVYFKRLEMAKARSVVIFVLATAVLMTIGSLILAFLLSGGF